MLRVRTGQISADQVQHAQRLGEKLQAQIPAAGPEEQFPSGQTDAEASPREQVPEIVAMLERMREEFAADRRLASEPPEPSESPGVRPNPYTLAHFDELPLTAPLWTESSHWMHDAEFRVHLTRLGLDRLHRAPMAEGDGRGTAEEFCRMLRLADMLTPVRERKTEHSAASPLGLVTEGVAQSLMVQARPDGTKGAFVPLYSSGDWRELDWEPLRRQVPLLTWEEVAAEYDHRAAATQQDFRRAMESPFDRMFYVRAKGRIESVLSAARFLFRSGSIYDQMTKQREEMYAQILRVRSYEVLSPKRILPALTPGSQQEQEQFLKRSRAFDWNLNSGRSRWPRLEGIVENHPAIHVELLDVALHVLAGDISLSPDDTLPSTTGQAELLQLPIVFSSIVWAPGRENCGGYVKFGNVTYVVATRDHLPVAQQYTSKHADAIRQQQDAFRQASRTPQ